jgi:hypothetical protein
MSHLTLRFCALIVHHRRLLSKVLSKCLEPDPVPVVPPEEGLDYLALLRTERERLLQEQLQGIQFTQLTSAEEKND